MKLYLTMVKRMTNYERIKQMSTKEMARLLGSVFVDCDEFTRTIDGKIIFDSFDSIEEWLESEVDDNDKMIHEDCQRCHTENTQANNERKRYRR